MVCRALLKQLQGARGKGVTKQKYEHRRTSLSRRTRSDCYIAIRLVRVWPAFLVQYEAGLVGRSDSFFLNLCATSDLCRSSPCHLGVISVAGCLPACLPWRLFWVTRSGVFQRTTLTGQRLLSRANTGPTSRGACRPLGYLTAVLRGVEATAITEVYNK